MVPKKSLQSDVAALVLAGRLSDDREKFWKMGPEALRLVCTHVSPAKRRLFTKAFEKLVFKHQCREEVLFECLFLFCNAAIGHLSNDLPGAEEVHSLRRDLERIGTKIERFNETHVIDALRDHNGGRTYFQAVGDAIAKGKSPGERLVGALFVANQEQDELLRLIHWYQRILQIWWVPRKDIVRSYGPIAISLYPEIATGASDFETVAELLNCFNYQIEYDGLRKNVSNFKKLYPDPFSDIRVTFQDSHKAKQRELDHLQKFVIGNPPRLDWNLLFDSSGTKSRGTAAGKL